MESFGNFISFLDGWVWGWPLIILLFGTHLFLTFRTGIQRFIFKAIKISVTKDDYKAQGDVSQFSALATALAATIGTGNIVGVATAVALGGPGAVLWTWLTGVFGIATKYGEAVLSVKYRVKKPDGEMAGGPMYVCEHGLHMKWLGVVFAFFAGVAAFGIGNMVQANSISSMVNETFKVSPYITGGVMAALTAVVILGGVKRIAAVCDKLVPIMAAGYVLGCLFLLIAGADTLGATVVLICTSAFSGQAAVGGFAGAAVMAVMRFGIARGLFSNESGLGSAPIVAAAAQTRNPVKQALVSMTGTFWDTVVVCLMTGLVVVNSGGWALGLKGAALTKYAFEGIPVIGPAVLTFGLLTFVFSTILGWSYYGERAWEYLFGIKIKMPYRFAWIVFVFVGSILELDLVWNLADLFNGLMAVPNLVTLLLLSGVIVSETKKYLTEGDIDQIAEHQAILVDEKGRVISGDV